jgi:membrane protease YdiL (CAAX protease family)
MPATKPTPRLVLGGFLQTVPNVSDRVLFDSLISGRLLGGQPRDLLLLGSLCLITVAIWLEASRQAGAGSLSAVRAHFGKARAFRPLGTLVVSAGLLPCLFVWLSILALYPELLKPGRFLEGWTAGILIFAFALAVGLGPLIEEFVLKTLILGLLARIVPVLVASAVSVVIFALAHPSWLAGQEREKYVFVMGLFFLVAYWLGGYWSAFILHAGWNCLVMFISLLIDPSWRHVMLTSPRSSLEILHFTGIAYCAWALYVLHVIRKWRPTSEPSAAASAP